MSYIIPAATLLMLGYVFWRAAFRMRADRLTVTREQTRGKFAFRPRERLRFLLDRSFAVPAEKPEWEEPLVSRLTDPAVPLPSVESPELAETDAETAREGAR